MRRWRPLALLLIVPLLAGCPKVNPLNPAAPVQNHAQQIVQVTAKTLTWFYHLDKRLIYCQPGLAVKDTQATVYWLALNHLGYSNTVRYHHNAALCTALRTSLHMGHPHPKITKTVIVTVTPTP